MKGNDGFTLVELMVTIAILGVLSAVAIPNYLGYVRSAKTGTSKTNYFAAVRFVRSQLAMTDSGSALTTDAVGALNGGGNKSPFSTATPAFVASTTVAPGQVGLSTTNLQALPTGGTVTVVGEWTGGHTADGSITLTKN